MPRRLSNAWRLFEEFLLIEKRQPRPAPRLYTGAGSLDGLPQIATALGDGVVWLVTDPGLVGHGYSERATSLLESAGFRVICVSEVQENPDSLVVKKLGARLLADRPALIVALGGGSTLDTAKAANLLAFSGGEMADYRGYGKAKGRLLPMVGIPTTTGTGSESQSYAVIEERQSHLKMACGDPQLLFHTVILDPELALSQPRRVAAVSGLDAITHALESHVTLKRSPLSHLYSQEAWKLLSESFPAMVKDQPSLETVARMQWGAYLAGAAIEQSMLGACHASANPLTAHYGLVHGLAVSIMMPAVLRFNSTVADGGYSALARLAGLPGIRPADELARLIETFALSAGLPTRLRDCGVSEGIFPILAEEAFDQWTGKYNPRSVSENEFIELYQSAY